MNPPREVNHPKKRIKKGVILSAEEAAQFTARQEFAICISEERVKGKARIDGGELSQRHCKQCSKPDYNLSTCNHK